MNVTSVAFVSKYLETGMPLTTKRLTVDGDIVKQPKNVEVIIAPPSRSCWTSAEASPPSRGRSSTAAP